MSLWLDWLIGRTPPTTKNDDKLALFEHFDKSAPEGSLDWSDWHGKFTWIICKHWAYVYK
jgi:hypothetical protein